MIIVLCDIFSCVVYVTAQVLGTDAMHTILTYQLWYSLYLQLSDADWWIHVYGDLASYSSDAEVDSDAVVLIGLLMNSTECTLWTLVYWLSHRGRGTC